MIETRSCVDMESLCQVDSRASSPSRLTHTYSWQTRSVTRDLSNSQPRWSATWALWVVAIGGASIAAIQLRHGIVPLLDTVTYWSGAESFASGHGFHTTLAPSFSNFDAIEFLRRQGSIPFVDFPIGYPFLAGSLGAVIGVRQAMILLTIGSVAAAAATVVLGCPVKFRPPSWAMAGVSVLSGILLSALPSMRLVTQGTLSEPLFIASVMGFVIALTRFRDGRRWTPVVIFVVLGSLLRFLGAPLALLAGWEHYHKGRHRVRSLLWTTAMVLPAAVNIIGASTAGGGHNAEWRGFERADLEVFVRSVGGWFDGRQGDIRRTYFTVDGPSWWSWPITVLWIVLVCIASFGILRRRHIFPASAEIALGGAGILTIGLLSGIAGFDALVIADNRLMLPIGFMSICAVLWIALDLVQRVHATTRTTLVVGLTIVSIWGVCAVRPWNVTERFSDVSRPLALSKTAEDAHLSVIISNDADGVHWDTDIPSAYTPMAVKPLTGERIDDTSIYRALPCALHEAHGALVISNEATFSTVNRPVLDDLVDQGFLERVTTEATTVFTPTSTSCASD